jgi:hypothetical protein
MIKPTTKKYEDINKGNYLSDSSMLRLFPILNNEEEYVYNIFRPYIVREDIFNDKNFDIITLSTCNWWENIAYSYYYDAKLWWVLAITNKITNPFEEISDGDKVYELKRNFISVLKADVEKVRHL